MSEKEDGQAKGGMARAAKLSKEERSAIAREGARAKWSRAGVVIRTMPTALYGSPEKPLRIGDTEINCYVLDDERRVLVQRGLQTSIGMSTSGGAGGAHRMGRFVESLEAKGVNTNNLSIRMRSPILFKVPPFNKPAYGYEATVLTEICDAVLEARQMGVLPTSQDKYATQCEILLRSLAKTGIVALVDEATGYQEVRQKNALALILEKFISKELQKWAKKFPFEFYEEIFRLKDWDTSELTPGSPKPLAVGKITDNLIYRRLAPGVRDELKRLTPRTPKGYLSNKLHQRLTDDIGNPKLEKHIGIVLAVMKLSPDWESFISNINKVLPIYDRNYELALDA